MPKVRCDICGKNSPSVKWRFTLDWRVQKTETAVHLCNSCWHGIIFDFGKPRETTEDA